MSQTYQKPSAEKVKKALADLGETADQVAVNLFVKGIKGNRREGETCPVNEYLEQVFPGTWFKTQGSSILVGINTDNPDIVAAGAITVSFVSAFDNGRYGFLDA